MPFIRVADAHGVDVAVVEQDLAAVADAPDDIAHFVPENFVKAETGHLGGDAFAAVADLTVHTGNGADLAQEADNWLALLFYSMPQLSQFCMVYHAVTQVSLESQVMYFNENRRKIQAVLDKKLDELELLDIDQTLIGQLQLGNYFQSHETHDHEGIAHAIAQLMRRFNHAVVAQAHGLDGRVA